MAPGAKRVTDPGRAGHGMRSGAAMELVVVAGTDAGSRFMLLGDRLLLGRGQPESGRADSIRLADRSVSRKQAWILRDASGTSIEHVPDAVNPTRVNGVEVTRATLAAGDRIEIGHVVMDVRVGEGTKLSVLTEFRPPEAGVGELRLVRGIDSLRDSGFVLLSGTTTIGRGEQVDVRIPESGVSRLHAEIRVTGSSIELIHLSQTNPTFVNGLRVTDRATLEDGDRIQIADRVVLALHLDRSPPAPALRPGLSQRMEEKVGLEREIETFQVLGSFLDVDVVDSRSMKNGQEKPEHIIVSFERFRGYVSDLCEAFEGQVLNSNGDELMCFFERAACALRAGSAILEGLPEFNRDANLLTRNFRFRLGVHTGVSLVDLRAGIAYSHVLDTAGHIQKMAEPDSLLVSSQTREAVGGGAPLTLAGRLPDGGEELHRLERFLTASDRLAGEGSRPEREAPGPGKSRRS